MRRIAAIGAVVVAMLAAVAIAAVLLVENANAKTTAWVVTRDLVTGATVDATSAHQIQVPTGTDTYTVLTGSPVGKQVSHALHAGDVLRPDDLVTATMVQVPVSFKLAPGLTANDVVDIYAVGSGSSTGAVNSAVGTRLIARGISVVAVGSPSVIEVPANQEPLWVTLSSSSVTLIATRSDGVDVPSADHSYSTDEVLTILAELAAGTPVGSGSAPPSPTPSGAP